MLFAGIVGSGSDDAGAVGCSRHGTGFSDVTCWQPEPAPRRNTELRRLPVVHGAEVRFHSDATKLDGDQPSLLIHVLSDALLWGLGFTQAIDARWPSCAESIRQRRARAAPIRLGDVLWSELTPSLAVGHLIAERARGNPSSPLELPALATCLDSVAERALVASAAVHCPPLGTGLGGARWDEVSALLHCKLVARGIAVVVHCLGQQIPFIGVG